MALDVRDGQTLLKSVKTTVDGDDHVPHHNIDNVAPTPNVVSDVKAVAVPTNAVALGPSTALKSGIRVQADIDNVGLIYLGDSGVDSSNGYKMQPGQAEFIETDDLAKYYIDADNAGDSVQFFGG